MSWKDIFIAIQKGIIPSKKELVDGTTAVGNALQLGGKGASEYMLTGGEYLTTSIKEKALAVPIGTYFYHLGGASYTGGDLPNNDNSWAYGSAMVMKRGTTSIEIVMFAEATPRIAITTYNGVIWNDWAIEAVQADLADYQNKNDRRVLDTSAITTPTDIRTIISNYPSGAYTFASFENSNIIMPFEDAVGVMIEWERVFNPTYSAAYGILTVKSMTHCNHSYSCVVYNTNMYTEWVDNNPLNYLPLSGGNVTEDVTIGKKDTSPYLRLEALGAVSVRVPNGTTGSWDRGFKIVTEDGTDLGGLGVLGTVQEVSYYYIGNEYWNPILAVTPSTRNVTVSGNVTFSKALPENVSPTVVATFGSNNSTNGFSFTQTANLWKQFGSASVKIQETAPTDTTALWVY